MRLLCKIGRPEPSNRGVMNTVVGGDRPAALPVGKAGEGTVALLGIELGLGAKLDASCFCGVATFTSAPENAVALVLGQGGQEGEDVDRHAILTPFSG